MYSLPPEWAWPLQFCAASTAGTYIASVLTGNVSQVDRVWTFLPTIYSAYFALLPLWPRYKQPFPLCPYVPEELSLAATEYSPRALVMFGLTVAWMSRLSYNTYRRGLFSFSDEDYRWVVLRRKIPTWAFQVVNISFIACIQNVLLLLLGLPTYIAAAKQPHTALTTSDLILALLSFATLVVEFTSDNQQYSFQTFKHSYLNGTGQYDEAQQWPGSRLAWTPADAKRGFLTRGLWAWSRHPNFTCEQLFWWLNALFPVLTPDPPAVPTYTLQEIVFFFQSTISYLSKTPFYEIERKHLYDVVARFAYPMWPLTSAICLSLLFFSSTLFTEEITRSKYPVYAIYQRRVAMFGFIKTLEMSLYYRILGGEKKAEIDDILWGSDTGKGKGKEE